MRDPIRKKVITICRIFASFDVTIRVICSILIYLLPINACYLLIQYRQLDKQQQVLLTHGDSITELGSRLKLSAVSTSQVIAGIWNEELRIFGVQFHPEVSASILSPCHIRFTLSFRLHFRLTSPFMVSKCCTISLYEFVESMPTSQWNVARTAASNIFVMWSVRAKCWCWSVVALIQPFVPRC